MGNPKTTIGLRFLCIRNVSGLYLEGNIYKSEVEGCITNELGNKDHEWIEYPEDIEWRDVFRIIGNKKRSGWRSLSMYPRCKDAGR
jgi:hypothetical protein